MDKLMILVLIMYSFSHCESSRITAGLEGKIEELVNNALGVEQMQVGMESNPAALSWFSFYVEAMGHNVTGMDHLDNNVVFENKPFDGVSILQEAADKMELKYSNRVSVLRETLAEGMAESYDDAQAENPYENCCDPNGHFPDWDEQLGLWVDYNRICVVGTGLDQDADDFIPVSVVRKWKETYEIEHRRGIQWIYYGSEQGVMYNYPAVRQCDSSYDPRYRPFYIETVTPIPKDIVLVVDRSGSMGEVVGGETLMDIAIGAARTVVNTLSINDRVGVVTFAENAETPSGSSTSDCYANQLSRATYENKQYLKRTLNQVTYVQSQQSGATNYRKALNASFELFKNTSPVKYDMRPRSKVILFLTDGKPTDCEQTSENNVGMECENIYEDISRMNAELNNSVIILTYGLGSSIGSDVATILENMAKQIRAVGEVTVGSFTAVENPGDLRSVMASYYHMFVRAENDKLVHFTVPYQDAFGSGIIVSMCVPVNVGTKLKGVICMDEPVTELLSELSSIQLYHNSYSFMVDIYSRVLSHPNAHIENEITNHPKFTFLRTLEIDNYGGQSIDEMVTCIINEMSGNTTANTKRIIPRGDVLLDGVSAFSTISQYFWKTVPGTKYVVGVALAESDRDVTIDWMANHDELPQNFVYHKLNDQGRRGNVPTCSHYSATSSKDTMVTQFSRKAFIDPYRFLFTSDDDVFMDTYKEYFTRTSAELNTFQTGVRDNVAATAVFEDILKRLDDESGSRYNHRVMWRYLATDNGMMRIYPAVELPKTYDATERQWYKLAKANNHLIAVTRPYMNRDARTMMISLARVIFEGRSGSAAHDRSTRPFGVMGIDVSPFYFYKIMKESVPDCNHYSCFMVDRSGFIVFHDDWMNPDISLTDMINVHVTEKEPEVAEYLIDNLFGMKYARCVNIFDVRNQYTWRLSGQSLDDHSTSNFAIHTLTGTNLLLIVKKRPQTNPQSSCFECLSGINGYSKCEQTVQPGECFCPCYSEGDTGYLFCEDLFSFSSDNDPLCSPPLPFVDFSSVPMATPNLTSCYDFDCGSQLTEIDCRTFPSCNWCISEEASPDLCDPERVPSCNLRTQCAADQSFITNLADCPTTALPVPEKKSESKEKSDGVPGWAIALIVLGILTVLVLIASMLIVVLYLVPYLRSRDDGIRNELDDYDHLPDEQFGAKSGPFNINRTYDPTQTSAQTNQAFALERHISHAPSSQSSSTQHLHPQRQISSSAGSQSDVPQHRTRHQCMGVDTSALGQSPDVLGSALTVPENYHNRMSSEYIGQRSMTGHMESIVGQGQMAAASSIEQQQQQPMEMDEGQSVQGQSDKGPVEQRESVSSMSSGYLTQWQATGRPGPEVSNV